MIDHQLRPLILVVEDESLVRMMAVDMFEEAGFRVVEASSGEKALRVLEECGTLTALFTDVDLSNSIDGFHLAKVAFEAHPDMPIIVVSGQYLAKKGDLPEGARFIPKPYEPERVTKTLHEMIAQGTTGA